MTVEGPVHDHVLAALATFEQTAVPTARIAAAVDVVLHVLVVVHTRPIWTALIYRLSRKRAAHETAQT